MNSKVTSLNTKRLKLKRTITVINLSKPLKLKMNIRFGTNTPTKKGVKINGKFISTRL